MVFTYIHIRVDVEACEQGCSGSLGELSLKNAVSTGVLLLDEIMDAEIKVFLDIVVNHLWLHLRECVLRLVVETLYKREVSELVESA